MNAGVSGNHIYKAFSFSVNGKYQNSYEWQSFLINGLVPSILTVDAMVQYEFTKPSLNVKLGASNVLNNYYYSILGGPQIGGFYYTKVTYTF